MAHQTKLSRSRIVIIALAAGLLLAWAVLRVGFGMLGLDWLVAAAVAANIGDAIHTALRERQRRSRSAA